MDDDLSMILRQQGPRVILDLAAEVLRVEAAGEPPLAIPLKEVEAVEAQRATEVLDVEALGLLRDWIRSLPPP